MAYTKESLWAKAVLFMQYANESDKETAQFGIWCALSFEILARSAIAYKNPILLAEPDRDHKNLLVILNLGSVTGHVAKSIGTVQVLKLCESLIPNFLEEDLKFAIAFVNRRNEELHTGASSFVNNKNSEWLYGFYKCCKILCDDQEKSLKDLLGSDEVTFAESILHDIEIKAKNELRELIKSFKITFNAKEDCTREELSAKAKQNSTILSWEGHHKVKCPACGSEATVVGKEIGPDKIENKEDEIVVRRSVIPTEFNCIACGLKIQGYPQLVAAGIGDYYTRRTTYSPQDYYELIDPNDFDPAEYYAERYGEEYNNE